VADGFMGISGEPAAILLNSERVERFGELHHKIDRTPATPAVRDSVSTNRVVAFHFERTFNRMVSYAVRQIQNDVGLVRFGKCIFVKTAPLGCGQLNGDFGIFQKNGVVTGSGMFLIMQEA